MKCGCDYLCLRYKAVIWRLINVLVEDKPQPTLSFEVGTDYKAITALQRKLVIDFQMNDYEINALLVHCIKVYPKRKHPFVSRMFKVVQIVCIIDDTL